MFDRESFLSKQSIKWILILLGLIGALFIIATIVLAILYGIERNHTKYQNIIQSMLDKNDTNLINYLNR